MHELAALVPASANAGHYARIIREAAILRGLIKAGGEISRLGWERPGEAVELAAKAEVALRNVLERVKARSLAGLTHAEALTAETPLRNELVEGLIDVGTVGVIAGLPFARKSWVGMELAHKIAAGIGKVFGRYDVLQDGPVVYVWQDDSTAKELERIQAYNRKHDYPPDLRIRFLLNEGIRLPDDLPALRALVERDWARFLVIDSLYNVLSPTVGLKDEDVAVVVAEIKREICDRTGCTVCLVDHAPWPSESNRGQHRAYGSVFKTAAVRWSIHLEADAKDDTKLHVEAAGNNVRGFKRTPAYWDEDELEIRLVDTTAQEGNEAPLNAEVLDWLIDNPGTHSTTKVREAVKGRDSSIDSALERLKARAEVQDLGRDGGPWLAEVGTPRYWIASIHAEPTSAALFGPGSAGVVAGAIEERTSAHPALPRRGAEVDRAGVDEDEIERLASVALETDFWEAA